MSNVRKSLRWMPRPLLIAMAAVSLPLHLLRFMVGGVIAGYRNWSEELREVIG